MKLYCNFYIYLLSLFKLKEYPHWTFAGYCHLDHFFFGYYIIKLRFFWIFVMPMNALMSVPLVVPFLESPFWLVVIHLYDYLKEEEEERITISFLPLLLDEEKEKITICSLPFFSLSKDNHFLSSSSSLCQSLLLGTLYWLLSITKDPQNTLIFLSSIVLLHFLFLHFLLHLII